MKKYLTLFLSSVSMIFTCAAQTAISGLLTENQHTPLGIDEKLPAFSWQMHTPRRGASQKAYELVVTDENGTVCWDSQKVTSGRSINIIYDGKPLRPATRYQWTTKVWDERGGFSSASSWFETGLMDPDAKLGAWNGADWIGGKDQDLVLYSPYLSIYKLSYRQQINEGTLKASYIIGANDKRLMDKNKNIYQLENKKDQSYIQLELDISELGRSPDSRAKFNVYRAGYAPTDHAETPLISFDILPSVIGEANKNKPHTIEVVSLIGKLLFSIDGNSAFAERSSNGTGISGGLTHIVVNPLGADWNCITYGMLAEMGFSVPANGHATFSDVVVSNHRSPGNVIFKEDLTNKKYQGIFKGNDPKLSVENGKYTLVGGTKGAFIVADPSHNAMPLLRTKFDLKSKKIKKARLYVTARGIYELYLNGQRVGSDQFNPGLTQYTRTQLYQTYDVTDLVRNGPNALGAMLGEGWWSGLLSYGIVWNHFGDRQSLLGKLAITFQDGTTQIVTTNDKTWKYSNDGPIKYSSLDLGEIYDARRDNELKGWASSGFDDSKWGRASIVKLDGTAYTNGTKEFDYGEMKLIGQIGNPARVFSVLNAKSVSEVRPGVFVYDMGQNFTGVPRLSIKQGISGRKITLRCSEMLYPSLPESGRNVGMVMMENYRAALCTDEYTMKDGPQVYQPHFTFRGYRYLEVTGLDKPLPTKAVQGVVITSISKLTADYRTSNSKVNRLWSNLVWSNIDNFLSIPTDCPQRNERMGWSGDLNVFAQTATYVSNTDQFFKRHMYAMRDLQAPTGRFTDIAPVGGGFGGILWGSAGIVVPWQSYLQYGDKRVLQDNYEAMSKYVTYANTTFRQKDGGFFSTDAQLGDWLGPQNKMLGQAFLVNAYHIYNLAIMTKVASILGNDADVQKYSKMHAAQKVVFNKFFVNYDHKTLAYTSTSPGAPIDFQIADTQTSYAIGLALNAFSRENIPFMKANLASAVKRQNLDDSGKSLPEYSLMTGFIGTAWINKALSGADRSDLAYRLLQNEQYPSWLYAVNQGATTIWERLNGYTLDNGFGGNNKMNSFNHYSFGAIGEWMIAYSLGIRRDENSPGFKHFILRPEYDPTHKMTSAQGHYDSPYGRIKASWQLNKDQLTYKFTIPANTSATLMLPLGGNNSVDQVSRELKAGTYTFTSTVN